MNGDKVIAAARKETSMFTYPTALRPLSGPEPRADALTGTYTGIRTGFQAVPKPPPDPDLPPPVEDPLPPEPPIEEPEPDPTVPVAAR